MLTILLISSVLAAGAPVQTANPACAILTPQDVTALIGAGATPIGISASPGGASCMYQNRDKVVTILLAKQTSAESAESLWSSKKRVVAGQDVPGWACKAYAGAMGASPAVGLTKGTTFLEVKIADPAAKLPELTQKLQTVMKGVAGRL